MPKVRILMSGMSSNIGGIETFIYNFYKNMDKEKYQLDLLVLDYGKKVAFEDELVQSGTRIFRITPRSKNYFKFKRDLKNVYKSNEFDIIHLNLMNLACPERIIYAHKYSKAKIVIHSHHASANDMSKINKIFDKIGRLRIRNIKYYRLACGNDAGVYMFGKNQFKIVNNGIDIEKFAFNEHNRTSIRKTFNIKENEICIGLVAAFLPVKNHKFLIDIFNQIVKSKSNLNFKLMLIGIGPNEFEIKNKVEQLDLVDNVLFLGRKMDANRYYSAMDIYIMPSICEGLSISLCEAQINGLKCYTSDRVDRKSNITGNVEFLSLDKDCAYWANYINENQNSRDSNVLEKVPEEFRADRAYRMLFDFYESLL